jgi:membrane associated rhomboid family serine protease
VGAYLCYLGIEAWSMTQMGEDPTESMNSMLGASGAIFGVMAAFMSLFPNYEIMLLFFPVPIRAKYLIMALVLVEWYLGSKGSSSGVAHMAHFGGALFGLILIAFWYRKK